MLDAIGIEEIGIIFVIFFILFDAKHMAQLARLMGKAIGTLQKLKNRLMGEINLVTMDPPEPPDPEEEKRMAEIYGYKYEEPKKKSGQKKVS